MATIRDLPGLTSEHEFWSPVDENFERDMEAIFANATRGEIETPTMWPMGPYHRLYFNQAKSGVPMLPMDQALNNPNGPWGGIKGTVQWTPERRGLRGLGAQVTPVPWYNLPLGQGLDEDTGQSGMLLVAGGLLAAWVVWMMMKDRESAFI